MLSEIFSVKCKTFLLFDVLTLEPCWQIYTFNFMTEEKTISLKISIYFFIHSDPNLISNLNSYSTINLKPNLNQSPN